MKLNLVQGRILIRNFLQFDPFLYWEVLQVFKSRELHVNLNVLITQNWKFHKLWLEYWFRSLLLALLEECFKLLLLLA